MLLKVSHYKFYTFPISFFPCYYWSTWAWLHDPGLPHKYNEDNGDELPDLEPEKKKSVSYLIWLFLMLFFLDKTWNMVILPSPLTF